MLASIAVALSIVAPAAIAAIDVPFVPQSEALCGGAAAAMVFRYWGDARAGAQQFAPLVERHPGGIEGIATGVLDADIRARGWRTEPLEAAANGATAMIAALRARLDLRQPVIVLLADRRDRYHYVVVTAAGGDAVVVHDPSWGPSRSLSIERFTRLWSASDFWSLVVLPPESGRVPAAAAAPSEGERAASPSDPCDAALDAAIDEVRARGMESADAVLDPILRRCPASAGPRRELAGVRFAQKRWREAASYAAEAVARDAYDEYALDVLGASRFMQDDAVGALRAWNQIGKPKLDLVRIDGLRHTRYQTMVELLGLEAGRLLTTDAYVLAGRRLEDLPNRASSRIGVRPQEDGTAAVEIGIAERSLPTGLAWIGTGVHAAIEREIAVSAPGFTGQGDVWTASWRWWNNRPRVAASFAAPRIGGLPGVWTVDASWEAQTYAIGGGPLREEQTHAGLSVSDWLTGAVRYSVNAGVDAWSGERRSASVGGSIERRWRDAISVSGHATEWLPIDGSSARFSSIGARAALRSTIADRRWAFESLAGVERVSDASPFALWPGAGDGRARPLLLRAHPLLDDGIVDADDRHAFGRTLRYASGEVQRWLPRPVLVPFGVAGFVDVASAARQAVAGGVAQIDTGIGLRVKVPGAPGAVRIDYAHGLRDGADAVTVGWTVR